MEISSILTFFESNIYVFLLVVPFISQLGIPIGAMFFILYAGSLATNFNELVILFFISFFSTFLGDLTSYFIGRKLYNFDFFKNLLQKKIINNIYIRTEKFFHKNGGVSIFLSRFLITGVGPALNYVVGFHLFNYKKFIFYVVLGEILYSLELLILGYLFKETFGDIFNIFSNFGIGLLLIFILYQILKRLFRKKHNQ
ncbi:MAG: VTT domain-containing protein [Candidatus Gracilibacteria bacterium]|nr:VTT domain-containing protein [Candidatus Gracilibacteria bacterium]